MANFAGGGDALGVGSPRKSPGRERSSESTEENIP